ncbi:ribosomal protein S5 domain 2-type protein [Spinellus fusiger]|nr:ribosomal protein S5 domain 2-type protein [Spinellus fusiger]
MTTIVSAPGKVLLTGGYLVLDQAYQGLVVGTSARFYTIIRPSKVPGIHVHSPQFKDAHWEYTVQADPFVIECQRGHNPFVEPAIRFTLSILREKMGKEAWRQLHLEYDIVIVGDNDFYSQQAQLQSLGLSSEIENLEKIPAFAPTHCTLSSVHKTGLGSSAALTTSLVAALYAHLLSSKLDTREDLQWVHNIAQFVHCYAQGKVGSGFDVSAAVWGSHCYRRFHPRLLNDLMKEDTSSAVLLQQLSPENEEWDHRVVPFTLPPRFELMLADIDAGSHTPTLASKVLAWRTSHPEQAHTLWQSLSSYNTNVEHALRELQSASITHAQEYEAALDLCATHKPCEWETLPTSPVMQSMVGLVKAFANVRQLLREMSQHSNVPIEPQEQTQLLDACESIPGAVMAGVPGAGGYDAIYCIVLSTTAKTHIHAVWKEWKLLNVAPLLSTYDSNGVTLVQEHTMPGFTLY